MGGGGGGSRIWKLPGVIRDLLHLVEAIEQTPPRASSDVILGPQSALYQHRLVRCRRRTHRNRRVTRRTGTQGIWGFSAICSVSL